MANKAKKLNLSNLQKAEKERSKKTKVTIEGTSNKWTVEIHNEFSKADISSLLHEVSNTHKELKNIGYELNGVFAPYIYMLAIKYFTSLGEDIPKGVNEQVEIMKILINEEVFIPLIESLPKDQVEKLLLSINDFTKSVNQGMDNLEDQINDISLKNIEINKRLNN
jgi:hypothetical protein